MVTSEAIPTLTLFRELFADLTVIASAQLPLAAIFRVFWDFVVSRLAVFRFAFALQAMFGLSSRL